MQHTQNTDLLNPALDPRELVPALARASGGAHRRRITHPAYPTHLLRPHDAPPTVGVVPGAGPLYSDLARVRVDPNAGLFPPLTRRPTDTDLTEDAAPP